MAVFLLAQLILLYGQNVQATHSVLRLAKINRAWFSLTITHLYVAPVSGEVKVFRVSENSAVGDFITEACILHLSDS